MFKKSVIWILLANIALAFASYAVLVRVDMVLALAAFMTAIAPTATAAPVLIGFIQGEIEYVVTAVLFTNVSIAIVIPLTLPSLLGADVHITFRQVLQPVLITMFVPLILSRLVSYLPKVQAFVRQGKTFSFPLWLLNLFIVTANASNFLRTDRSDSAITLITMALISLVICIVNFGVGALLGGRRNWQEASQSLGQKNLSFVIWVALTFINPLVAMGPTFYILFHHLYNSWSIYQFEKRRNAAIASD
jgi:BASS family bile acid:Na+ symporter